MEQVALVILVFAQYSSSCEVLATGDSGLTQDGNIPLTLILLPPQILSSWYALLYIKTDGPADSAEGPDDMRDAFLLRQAHPHHHRKHLASRPYLLLRCRDARYACP